MRKTKQEHRPSQIVVRRTSSSEYAFGIISPLSQNYSPTFYEGLSGKNEVIDRVDHCGFETWSLSIYQSLYHPEYEEELRDDVSGDYAAGLPNKVGLSRVHPQFDPSQASPHVHRHPKESWLLLLAHLPEKIHQHYFDRHRFNVNKVSTETREQLKCLYAY